GFLEYENFELLIQPYENAKLEKVESLFTGNNFNGAIIANASDADLEFLELNNINVPIVLYQRHSNKYCTVVADSFNTGLDVANLLYSRGHKNVGIMEPDISSQA